MLSYGLFENDIINIYDYKVMGNTHLGFDMKTRSQNQHFVVLNILRGGEGITFNLKIIFILSPLYEHVILGSNIANYHLF